MKTKRESLVAKLILCKLHTSLILANDVMNYCNMASFHLFIYNILLVEPRRTLQVYGTDVITY